MKKKIIVLCLVACLAVTAVAGATLAYFTAEDSADNVFTMKGIQVEINEDFDPENAELLPGLDINKDVWVTNTGTTDAYVRVHIAIPAALDDGDPSFNASNNFLHFNFTEDSVQPGQWSWTPEMNEDVGYRGNGEGNWNYYTATIDGIDYGVYVVTYRTALAAGEQTATTALDKVYVDKSVECVWNAEKECYEYTDTKGNIITPDRFADANGNIKIKVFAEAAQTATFTDAYDALNTAFGTPGSDGYVAPWNR
ncbi:MAG TPA: BsaA family SipW-dependent biofilm matrix protein [Firmicutes bacterium]|nr:BsaA family SipW-dependent biofilm matrix protein [Bacillota bacterium]